MTSPDIDEQEPAPLLTRITINLVPQSVDALDVLVAGWRMNRTDSHNRALRIAARMHEIAPDGHFRFLRPDGSVIDIYLI